MVGGEVQCVVDVRFIEIGPVLDADPLARDVLERPALVEVVTEELAVGIPLAASVGDLGEQAVDLRDRPEADQLV